MGKHFDTLIQLARCIPDGQKTAGIADVKEYFLSLAKRATVFSLPLKPEDIFPKSRKNKVAYNKYLQNYLSMSRQQGKTLVTPFELTAIEDLDSVVFLDELGENKFRVTFSRYDVIENPLDKLRLQQAASGQAVLMKAEDRGFWFDICDVYSFNLADDEVVSLPMHDNECFEQVARDITTSATSYIEELVYMMDPVNSIVLNGWPGKSRLN